MKILVVDDSTAMRLLVIRTLKQAGFDGHDIQQAKDGNEAFEHLSKNPVDLVLADWNMPGLTGIDLLRKLRGTGATTKFGFITSEATAEMRKSADEAGANFMIAKPFNVESFERTLSPVFNGT